MLKKLLKKEKIIDNKELDDENINNEIIDNKELEKEINNLTNLIIEKKNDSSYDLIYNRVTKLQEEIINNDFYKKDHKDNIKEIKKEYIIIKKKYDKKKYDEYIGLSKLFRDVKIRKIIQKIKISDFMKGKSINNLDRLNNKKINDLNDKINNNIMLINENKIKKEKGYRTINKELNNENKQYYKSLREELKDEINKKNNDFYKMTLSNVKKSLLDGIDCSEMVNMDKLNKLICSDLLKQTFNNGFLNKIYENEYEQLIKYRKHILLGGKAHYFKKYKNNKIGRVQAKEGLCFVNLRREIRNTIACDYYTDIDIENCHPNIIYQIIKQNKLLDPIYLKEYIDNRNNQLNKIINFHKCNRDSAKQLFISVMYGSTYEKWISRLDDKCVKDKIEDDFIYNFIDEFKTITHHFFIKNKAIQHIYIKKNKEDKNDKLTNLKGKVLSLYIQQKEEQILECIFKYMKKREIINHNNDCGLCYDGIMINKNKFYPELLNELSEIVNNKFNLKLTFTNKEMDNNYNDILEEHYNKDLHYKLKDKKDIEISEYYNIDLTKYKNMDLIDLKIEDLDIDEETKERRYIKSDIIMKNDKYDFIIIKSDLGSGKTTSISEYINYKKDVYKSILIISPRILYSYTNKVGLLKDTKINFSIYKEIKENNIDEDYVIISIYSLCRISKNKKYDLIIMDESESNLSSFINEFGHIDYSENYNYLERLINDSKKTIFADKDIKNTTLDLIESFNRPSLLIKNENCFYNRTCNEFEDYDDINKKMFNDLDNNKKIVIFNNSKEEIKKMKELLKEKYPNKSIKTYYSNSSDGQELRKNDINDIWNIDILMYNMAITVGISFSLKNFDKLYIFLSNNDTNIRDLIQSSIRVRKLKDNEMNIYMKQNNEINYEEFNIENYIKESKKIIKYNLLNDKKINDYFLLCNKKYMLSIMKDKYDNLTEEEEIIGKNGLYNYIDSLIKHMPKRLYNIYHSLLIEKELNKRYYKSLFLYFISNMNYKYNYVLKSKKEKDDIKFKININKDDIYNNTIQDFNDLIEQKGLVGMNKEKLYEQIYNFIKEEEKNINTTYNIDELQNIKNLMNFNKKYEMNIEDDKIKNEIFKSYLSKNTKHKFTNYYNIYNEIDVYKTMFDQLKDKKYIELCKDNYEPNKILNHLIYLLKMDKYDLTGIKTINKTHMDILIKYINDNFKTIAKVFNISKIKKNDNNEKYYYTILCSIMINYLNIDIKYAGQYNKNSKTINYIINENNIFKYVKIIKNNNENINKDIQYNMTHYLKKINDDLKPICQKTSIFDINI